MKRILLVNGSVREGRVADKVAELVQAELRTYSDLEVSVVDFKQTPLPFMTSDKTPSDENFVAPDEHITNWLKQVDESDAVIMLVAEYNHSYTPVLKNAIDWGFKEWNNKPVGLVGYGWVGGARATAHLRGVLASNINAKAVEAEANLAFMKDIAVDGAPIDQAVVTAAIKLVIDELVAATS